MAHDLQGTDEILVPRCPTLSLSIIVPKGAEGANSCFTRALQISDPASHDGDARRRDHPVVESCSPTTELQPSCENEFDVFCIYLIFSVFENVFDLAQASVTQRLKHLRGQRTVPSSSCEV